MSQKEGQIDWQTESNLPFTNFALHLRCWLWYKHCKFMWSILYIITFICYMHEEFYQLTHWYLRKVTLLEVWFFNIFLPSDAIWQYIFGSILVLVMACYLTAPSHCPNQYDFTKKCPWIIKTGSDIWLESDNKLQSASMLTEITLLCH